MTETLKIGVVLSVLPDPRKQMGSKRLFLDLAEGLSKKGHDVTVFASEGNEEMPKRAEFRGSVYSYLDEHEKIPRLIGKRASRNFDLSFTISLFQETLFKRLDALISVNDIRPFITRNVGRKYLSLHMLPPFFSPPKSTRVRRLIKGNLSICCSKFLSDRTQQLFPDISDQFTFVYNGIDCGRFSRGNSENSRRKLNIPSDHFVVLFVGQMVQEKGVLHLVRAFREFHKQNAKSSLVIVGGTSLWGGNAKARLRWQAYYTDVLNESRNLPVYFAARVPNEELPDYYALGDVFVCPSVWQEAFGLVNIEAMAAGKPVIGTAVGGIPEIIRDGETGFLVAPGDIMSMKEKLLDLSNDERKRKSMGENGRKIAETQFSIDQMVDGYTSKIAR